MIDDPVRGLEYMRKYMGRNKERLEAISLTFKLVGSSHGGAAHAALALQYERDGRLIDAYRCALTAIRLNSR